MSLAAYTLPPLPGPDRRYVTLPCACGRAIRADRWAPADGIAHHQRTHEHRAWRASNGL